MNRIILLTLATLLTACGVDGEPTTPEPKTKPGISITGRAEIGVVKR